MEEREEDGITLGRLLSVLFGRKIIILIATISTLVVGLLFITLYYNRGKQTYTSQFNINCVGVNDGRYIDGSVFDYRDLVSRDTLNEIKNSNQKYSKINIDALISSDNIKIDLIEEKNKNDETVRKYYQITAKKKLFENELIARDFINDIANYPITKTIAMTDSINYYSFLENFQTANVYSTQIQYLQNQYDYIIKNYDSLIESYGDVTLSDNRILSSDKSELAAYFQTHSLKSLSDSLSIYGYIKDYSVYSSELALNIHSKAETYKRNLAKKEALKTELNALIDKVGSKVDKLEITTYNEKISAIDTENVDIMSDLKKLVKSLSQASGLTYDELKTPFADVIEVTGDDEFRDLLTSYNIGDKEAFEESLTESNNELKNFTSTYVSASQEVINKNSQVHFNNASVVSVTGGLNMVLGILLCLVGGVVIGAMINLVLDYSKLHDDPNKQLNTSEAK